MKNDAEAPIVAWLFREYLDNDLSLREIARRISVPRPDGSNKPWTKDTVKEILSDKAYAGYGFIGGGRGGTGRLRAKEVHNRAGYHEKAGVVPAIATLEQWEKAQAKLERNREENRKVRPAESSYLSGVLVCGHCGYRMDKHSRSERDGTKYTYFSCSSAMKRPALGCKQWRVREADILPLVIDRLVKEVDRSILEASNARPTEAPGNPVEALKVRLVDLVERLRKGYEDVLGAPAHRKAHFDAVLSKWEKEQADLERQIANLTVTEGDVSRFAQWWASVRGELITVLPAELCVDAEIGDDGQPTGYVGAVVTRQPVILSGERFRGLLKSLGFVVRLWWRPKECVHHKGTKRGQTYLSDRFYELDHASIEAGVKNAVAGNSNRCSRAHTRDKG